MSDPRFHRSVGRSRTGDQLHLHYVGCRNSSCNQRMKLRPVTVRNIKIRPGLFCVKCFGSNPASFNGPDLPNHFITE